MFLKLIKIFIKDEKSNGVFDNYAFAGKFPSEGRRGNVDVATTRKVEY